ncbi:hypothetical protein K1719_006565 [Acacia pycnantha]|nr:hypothetical protein K1719_006565 [Acacia pycnantha]
MAAAVMVVVVVVAAMSRTKHSVSSTSSPVSISILGREPANLKLRRFELFLDFRNFLSSSLPVVGKQLI